MTDDIGTATFIRRFSPWESLGYEEGTLNYNGSDTRYMGIFKHGKLVTVQSTRYKLFPNEKAHEVIERLSDKIGGTILDTFYSKDNDTQMYVMVKMNDDVGEVGGDKVSHGLTMYNSIDGSLKFGMRTFMTIGGIYVVLPQRYYKDLSLYVSKHMKSLETSVDKLVIVAQTLLGADYNLIPSLSVLTKVIYNKKHEEILKKNLPDKLFDNISTDSLSLYHTYALLCNRIWSNAKTDLTTKIHQFDVLHENVFDISFVERITDGV